MQTSIVHIVAALACLALMGGCVTPFVATGNHFGVGLFVVKTERHEHGVARTKIVGIGGLKSTRTVSVGYSDHDVLVVPVKERHYHVDTSTLDLYVGNQAVGAVGRWMADYHEEYLGRQLREPDHVTDSGRIKFPDEQTGTESK